MPAGSVLPNRDGSFDPLVEEQPPAPADAGVEAPVGSEFGVFDVGQDSDTSWQRFVVDDKVMAFNPKTRQVEPVLDESGNPVKATEKDKKMSNLQERAEMLRQSIRLKTGRKELSDAEEAAVLQEVVRFNALEAMMRKTMGGIGEDDL